MIDLIDFNLNHYIYVKLTKAGEDELKKQHDDLSLRIPNYTSPYIKPLKDGQGYSKFQGWSLMSKFGHMMSMCSELPFEIDIKFEKAK